MKRYLITLIFLICTQSFGHKLLADDELVIIIHSYGKGSVWTDSIDDGVRSALSRDLFSHQISSEYLDTKRYVGEEYLGSLLETYHRKYQFRKIKAIITSDDNAFHFAINFRKKLELKIPIVFSGVNGYHNYKNNILKNEEMITGIVEALPIKENLDLMKKIHPELKKVYFINTKHSASGRYVGKIFKKVISENHYDFDVVYLDDFTMPEIYKRSQKFEKDSAVLFGAYALDKNKNYYHFTDNMNELYRQSSRPIYAFFRFFLKEGVIGGTFLNGLDHGHRAAEMCLDLLNGAPISEVPIIKKNHYKTYFDFNVLSKFRISKNSLPSNASIVNEPFGISYFYNTFPMFFWMTVSSIIFLSCSIIFLVILLKNKINFEKKIIDLNKTLEQRVEQRTLQLTNQQDMLVSSAKLASVGEMASSIAHEINNPLAIIKMLCKKLQKTTNESDQNSLVRLNSTVDRITKIIKSLKLISRDDKGVELEVICIESVILETLNLSESRFRNAGIEISHNLKEAKTYIFANYVQMAQVIINLLNNAFDAVHELEDKWVSIHIETRGNFACLRVSDSGNILSLGISDKIMDPFFTTKELGKGTGLGLSISKNIINKHNGKFFLDLNSKYTCFVIEIPVALEYDKLSNSSL